MVAATCHRCGKGFTFPVPEPKTAVVARCPHCSLGWVIVEYDFNYALSDWDFATIHNVLSGMPVDAAFDAAGVPEEYRSGARFRLMQAGSTTDLKPAVLAALRTLLAQ